MKKRTKLLLGITSLCFALSGCSSVDIDAITESLNSMEESISQESETTPSEVTSEVSDSTPEEQFQNKLSANVSLTADQEIVMLCDDFDYNGEYEAFAFVGTAPVEGDEMGTFEGDIWYVDNDECTLLESAMSYYHILKCMDFGKRKYICFDRFFVTESPTDMYTVKNGSSVYGEYSGLGNVYDQKGNNFIISRSAYDVTYDASISTMIGHSWKPYYFYYDEATDSICEIGSHEISIEEATTLLPVDTLNLITAINGTVTTCILRDNGILNVNYEISYEDGSIDYCNANYDTVNGQYLDAYGTGENTLESSNFGGIYE